MPHVTIEYSANVAEHHDVASLVEAVHDAGLQHGLAPPDGLRTRALGTEHYRIADGQRDHAYVAIAVRIGPGRETEEKQSFIETLLGAAEVAVARDPSPLAIAWSIELVEIDPELRINRNHVRTRLEEQRGEHA